MLETFYNKTFKNQRPEEVGAIIHILQMGKSRYRSRKAHSKTETACYSLMDGGAWQPDRQSRSPGKGAS